MEKYEPLGVVGEGSYGVVLKCRNRESGRIVAIKKFIDSEDDQNVRKIALREIRVLRKLGHENLVGLIEVFRRRKHLYLVFEFIDHTLLDELESKSHGLDDHTSRKYVYQILRGLGFCHDNNIIHRDVKPENVLVSKGGIVKLCDFGFARNVVGPGEQYTDYVATRWYRAPELLVGDVAYGKEVDIWAVGCLFSEMNSGEPLFPGDSDIDQLFLIAQTLGRLGKRQLSIMSRNSAFRGFKFPKSRNSSTASTDSVKNTKLAKLDSGGGHLPTSIFASMFPSWSDESVQFLTLCLDPEPSGRPNCNALLRLPYFMHDGFPSRFMVELNTKLQLEGRSPISAYSTRKKPSSSSNVPSSSHQKPPGHGANVTSSLSPNHRGPPLTQSKNPLHQTRSNISLLPPDDLPNVSFSNNIPPKLPPHNFFLHASNNGNVSSSDHSIPNINNPQLFTNKFSREATFLVDKPLGLSNNSNPESIPKTYGSRKSSFAQIEPIMTNNNNQNQTSHPKIPNPQHSETRIPTLLQRKFSDDFLVKPHPPTSFSNSFSTNSNYYFNQPHPHQGSRSTPNITDETPGQPHHPHNNPGGGPGNKEKRFSIHGHSNTSPSQPEPTSVHRKYSYQQPPQDTQNDTRESKLFHHLPVTTLTLNVLGGARNLPSNSNNSGGGQNSYITMGGYPSEVKSPSTQNAASSKRSPSPTKPHFPLHKNSSSSYFPPQLLTRGPPSVLSKPQNVTNNPTDSFLPRMNLKSVLGGTTPTPNNNNTDSNSSSRLSTSPTKGAAPFKRRDSKWTEQPGSRKNDISTKPFI